MKTDALIQRVIREKFVNTTVITIAHRINTIADYDRVVVLRQGEVAEEGAPWKLIERKGLFYDMVRHTGKNAEDIKKKARLHFAHSRWSHHTLSYFYLMILSSDLVQVLFWINE